MGRDRYITKKGNQMKFYALQFRDEEKSLVGIDGGDGTPYPVHKPLNSIRHLSNVWLDTKPDGMIEYNRARDNKFLLAQIEVNIVMPAYGVWIDTSSFSQEKMPSHFLCGDGDGRGKNDEWTGSEDEAIKSAKEWCEITGVPCIAKLYGE